LVAAVEGIAQGCEALGIPVVGGNVSLYNEGPTGPILPTPVIGMVGEMPDASVTSRSGFAAEGQAVALVGTFEPSLVASELAARRGHAPEGQLPAENVEAALAAHAAVREAVRSGAVVTAHDVSEGGLATALAECCALGAVGCKVEISSIDDTALFGEAPGRCFVVAGDAAAIEAIPGAQLIGVTGGNDLVIADRDGDRVVVAVADIRSARDGGLKRYLP
jgi:phosphoribosylformylglycinamidine synthase